MIVAGGGAGGRAAVEAEEVADIDALARLEDASAGRGFPRDCVVEGAPWSVPDGEAGSPTVVKMRGGGLFAPKSAEL